MRPEGSPFQGVGAVFVKELSDNISSVRMLVLELLIVLTALAALYGAIDSLRQTTAEDPFLLLRLFTLSHDPRPSFVAILGFLIPLMAIVVMPAAFAGGVLVALDTLGVSPGRAERS